MLDRLWVEVDAYLVFMDLAREEDPLWEAYQEWKEESSRQQEADPPATATAAP